MAKMKADKQKAEKKVGDILLSAVEHAASCESPAIQCMQQTNSIWKQQSHQDAVHLIKCPILADASASRKLGAVLKLHIVCSGACC